MVDVADVHVLRVLRRLRAGDRRLVVLVGVHRVAGRLDAVADVGRLLRHGVQVLLVPGIVVTPRIGGFVDVFFFVVGGVVVHRIGGVVDSGDGVNEKKIYAASAADSDCRPRMRSSPQ